MATKLWIIPILLIISIFLISGCTSQKTSPETISQNITPQAPLAKPTSERLTLSAGELTTDYWGNDYTVKNFGGGGVDLLVNSKQAYATMDGYNLGCTDGSLYYYAITLDDSPTCAYAKNNVKVYLLAYDRITRKATIEVRL